MKRDGKLIWRLQNLPKNVKEQHNIDELIEEYEVAVGLSNGPDPGRSAHWSLKTQTIFNRLQKILVDHPVPEPTVKENELSKVET